ncbi:hypothetical protein H2200_011932 [Cladophialophora chaetospira]|uniref:Uncharacterized protein n=1 Tax=Cladophialophora chaetospira TaxID=386627 RepID=A0AA38WYZ3_9EURO|nr:hypothetical protein H2200_011932 [Cladophialophora chaetospira]
MITLPSARRLLLPTISILFILICLRLISDTGLFRSSQHALLQAAIKGHLSGGHANFTVLNASSHPHLFDGGPEIVYEDPSHKNPIPAANQLIRAFTTCPVPVNPYTGHIRLPNELYNINMIPPSSGGRRKRDEESEKSENSQAGEETTTRFFNPAIIPLPYWSHLAKYILVSRVVTSGFHQESHICLADICFPSPDSHSHSHLPADARPCTPADHAVLGPNGGLRCLTSPLKINIPPTPAEKCEGAWLAFPDIPGFHDPRVFWSGKGEPLILVNSASRYACVGLWIVDLRVVWPMLVGVLSREDGRGWVAGLVGRDMEKEEGQKNQPGSLRGLSVRPSMSYPHLTELTRNPRSSRAAVEKNWLLWFPNDDDAYVQYDLLSHPALHEDIPGNEAGQDVEGLARLGLGNSLAQADSYANATNSTTLAMNTTMSPGTKKRSHAKSGNRGGRTFAKLTGNGFTTPNLTHPGELACFSTNDHLNDSLGNIGHWHQGSNSLRLILCTRSQARSDPACKDDDFADVDEDGNEPAGAVESGRSVHFAIVHRKFSNAWELPMRYERYVVVWEGRAPFQILGVSKFPLLMKNEWAKPWTKEENWPRRENEGWNATGSLLGEEGTEVVRRARSDRTEDNVLEDEDGEKSTAYFTYTPSLAWTWRPHSAMANREEEEDDVEYMSQLGTGYLGEDVLVGIGLDDVSQAFVRVKVDDLLQCLRLCPGVRFADEEVS